jgi:polyisoprenoid-binding protein YceI
MEMNKLFYPLMASIVLLTSATLSITIQEYKVKEGFSIKFSSKDPSGSFEKMSGTVHYDKNDLENSSFDFVIDVASINTGNSMKNKKAQTSEWFYSSKHPKITFKSTKVVTTEKGTYVHGNLKMKGVTRFRKIPVKVLESKTGLKFTGTFWVDRSYYKIGKPSKTVPNKLKISYIVPVTKK